MIIAAAICPHPPLLVPAVASGARELDDLRAACAEAVRRLIAVCPDVICLVGDGPDEQWYDDGAVGSFQSYGVPLDVPLGAASNAVPTLPLSLTLGAWLLRDAGWAGRRCALAMPAAASDADLARLVTRISELAPAVGLLVMGDGSARRTEKAPGYVDPRAAGFDAAVATALAGADTVALAALDPALGVDLLAAGTTPWRLLGQAAAGASWAAALLADVAPYGVGYLVATWVRRR